MAGSKKPVLGVFAPRARPTLASAFWLASLLSIPIFVVLCAGELFWRWWFG